MMEAETKAPGGDTAPKPISWPRLLRRLLLLAALLVVGDLLLSVPLPTREYGHYYRPRWATFPRYLAYLRHFRRLHPERPIIVFLGPSTTWGISASPGHAIPDDFERALHRRYRSGPLSRAKVFNASLVAINLATQYYQLRALLPYVDAVYLQVHYRPFAERETLTMIPELLPGIGQWPDEQETRLMAGVWLSRPRTWEVSCSLWLAQHWALYRDRFALREAVYGEPRGTAEMGYEWYENWFELLGLEHRFLTQDRLLRQVKMNQVEYYWVVPWTELPPHVQRGISMSRIIFHCPPLNRYNRNLRFTERMLAVAQQASVPIFAFTAVFNRPIMGPTEDWLHNEYQPNMRVVKQAFEEAKVPLVDYNDLPRQPQRYFHDFDHLVDAGSAWQAQALLDDSKEFLEQVVAPRFAGGKAGRHPGRG